MTKEEEKIVSKAHYNLTKALGRPNYAPNTTELNQEIEKIQYN